jgi:ADP-ribosylglycohydrolase
MNLDKNIWLSGMMGLVVGDACGVPVEFMKREELRQDPVTDMREYGTHGQPRGTWSDDSSMALANLKSLHKGYNLEDIMEQFSRWDKDEVYTPFGEVFDMGYTCNQAIRRYQQGADVKSCGLCGEHDNGNGSLMRILPMCLYAYELEKSGDISEEEALQMIHDVSALTHAHMRSKMACGLYYFLVKSILEKEERNTLLDCLQRGFDRGFSYYRKNPMNLTEVVRFERLFNMEQFKVEEESTITRSGYVLAAFEAAIWSLLQADNYKDSILAAVNLGDDTDTTAAIAGGLAGLYYGYDGILQEWRECIIQKEWIEELCDW